MTNKKHYRAVFKSDHLACSDLEAFIQEKHSLIFTITNVRQESNAKVAGVSGAHNIAYFKENIKPLVLNAGNSKIMCKLAGGSSFVEDWINIPVQLYIQTGVRDPKGGTTSGIRINANPPRIEKPVITKENTRLWNRAKEVCLKDKNFNAVLDKAVLSPENQKLILNEIEDAAKATGNPDGDK